MPYAPLFFVVGALIACFPETAAHLFLAIIAFRLLLGQVWR
jgi:hypothetical protein